MGKASLHKKLRKVSRKSVSEMAMKLLSAKPWYVSKGRWQKVINKLLTGNS